MPNRATMIRSLLALQSERRSGVLRIDDDDNNVHVVMFLRGGVVVFAKQAPAIVTLGHRLQQQNIITADQCTRILAAVTPKARALDEHIAFCEAGIALNLLTADVAWSSLERFVRRTLVRTFQLSSVAWTFEDATPQSMPQLEYVARLKMEVEPLIVEAMRGTDRIALASEVERLLDVDVTLTAYAAEIAKRFELSVAEKNVLLSLDRTSTPLRALLATKEATTANALAVVAALAMTRVLRRANDGPSSTRSISEQGLTASQPPASSRSLPAAPISKPISKPPVSSRSLPAAAAAPISKPPESSRSLSVAAISKPPESSRSLPAVAMSKPPESSRSLPAAAMSKPPQSPRSLPATRPLASASAPRSDKPPTTDPYFAIPRVEASQASTEMTELGQQAMQTGIEHARAGRWSRAAPDLAQAVEHLPPSDELHLYALWSTIQARTEMPRTKGEAAELARAALVATKKNSDFAFGYYVAGDLALLDGDVNQAHHLLSRAMKLDPGLLDANRLLRVLERRTVAAAPSKGLFRKLW